MSQLEQLQGQIRTLIILKDDLQSHVDKSRFREAQAIRERDEARRIACFLMTKSSSMKNAAIAFRWKCFKQEEAP